MKRYFDKSRRSFTLGFEIGLAWVALSGLVGLPVSAANYYWGGSSSADWTTTANWQGGVMAPTGGAYDVTIVVTNKANNALTYTAANGNTLYTSGGRCLRIADGANGSMAITGGFLETRGTGDFVGNSVGVSGSLTIDGGVYVSTNNDFLLGANSAQGTLTVNSGSAKVATLRLWTSVGAVNLNGGVLALNAMVWQSGVATLNLNGGSLQAWKNTSAWMLGTTNWICKVNGSVVLDSQDCGVTNTASLNGTGTVTKVGSGLLALNVSNTVAAVTLNEGALSLGGSNTIGSGVTLNAGALNVNHAAALGSSALIINGGRIDNTSGSSVSNSLGGPINIYSNFTFLGSSDLNLGTGTVTICNNIVVSNAARTLTFGGSVTNSGGNYALTVASNGTLALTGSLGIGGRVTLSGGALTLSGANTYTGATTIGAGILYLSNSKALGATNGATSVATGAKIQMMNGVAVEGELVYLNGGGENWGAIQAAANSTSAWNGPIVLDEVNLAGWSPRLGHKSTGVLSIGGPIRVGAGGLGIHLWISGEPGIGRVIIASTNNTYTGITGIIRGTLAVGANNALPTATALDMHPAGSVTVDYSKFDLNGFNQTVGKLYESFATSQRFVTNSSDTASVLTVNQSANTVYAGRIDGNVGLVKDGAGSLTLGGTNAYTGGTTVKAGTLALGCDGALSPATSLTISNGTLNAGTWRNTLQQLTVTGAGTIALGTGVCRLEFADSSTQTWTGTLDLTGTLESTTVRFGTSSAGLTQAQLDLIRVNGVKTWLGVNAYGYLRKITGTIFLLQ
jgi:autotransporter-associated beta strand protein